MFLNRPSVSVQILFPIPLAACGKNTLYLDCGLTSTISLRHSSHTSHIFRKRPSTRVPIPPTLLNLRVAIDVPQTKPFFSYNPLLPIFSHNHPSHKPH
jgi:hypothetical protein